MSVVVSIVLGVISSLVASVCFWILTFKASLTDVVFSSHVAWTDEGDGKPRRMVIRVGNIGRRNLNEVKVVPILTIVAGDARPARAKKITLHDEGGWDIPIFPGRNQRCSAGDKTAQVFRLQLSETGRRHLLDGMTDCAVKELLLDESKDLYDLMELAKEDALISVYVFGTDAVTGVRRCFSADGYEFDMFKHGGFVPLDRSKKLTFEDLDAMSEDNARITTSVDVE